MAKLFGFKIEKDDDQNKNVVSPVPQSNEDSSDYYVSSGFYGQYVDIDGVFKSEFELIKKDIVRWRCIQKWTLPLKI